MTSPRSVIVWPLVLASLLAAPATARAQAGTPLTLEDALSQALAHAPRVAEARAREAAAHATVVDRQAMRKPTISANVSYLRTNHVEPFGFIQPSGEKNIVFPDLPNNYQFGADMSVPLYSGGRIPSLVESALADERAAASDRRALEEDVKFDVTRAYWGLATATEAIGVVTRTLERMDAYVSDVKARVDAGVLPPNDVLSAQAQRARQAVQLIQAKNAAASAELELARLIGRTPGQPIRLATAVDAVLPGVAETTALTAESLIEKAIAQRGERAALVDRQAALRASAQAAGAALRPQVNANLGVEPSRPNQRFVPRTDELKTSFDLGIGVTWSLFDGGRSRAQSAAAMAQVDALSQRIEDLDLAVALDIRQRLLDLESSRAALTASQDGIAAATEARRVVDQRFQAGVATSTDVLDAQVALLDAELERTRLLASLRLNEARLLRAIGGL